MRPFFIVPVLMLGCCTGNQAMAQAFSVSATGLAFGIYQPLSGSTVTTTATVTVTCTPPGSNAIALLVPYTVTLSAGGGGSFGARSMGGPSPRLSYQIYTDSGYSTVWGDGTGGTSSQLGLCLIGIGTLLPPIIATYTAYGRILAGTSASVGNYTDMITVSVTY